MSFKKENLKTEIKLSVKGGGEIDDAFLNFRVNECMKQIFTDTGILTLPRYITIQNGKIQDVELSSSNVNMVSTSGIGNVIRFMSLYEVTFVDGASNKYNPNEVDTRTLIIPSRYYISESAGSSLSTQLIFNNDLAADDNKRLELWAAVSSTNEGDVQEYYSHVFYNALLADVKYYLYTQDDRPWTNPSYAAREKAKYLEELRKLKVIKNKSFQGNREVKIKPISFI